MILRKIHQQSIIRNYVAPRFIDYGSMSPFSPTLPPELPEPPLELPPPAGGVTLPEPPDTTPSAETFFAGTRNFSELVP